MPETEATEKPDAETVSSWSYDVEGHARKCVEIDGELSKKDATSVHSRNTMHGKRRGNESVGELSTVCSQIVLTCQNLVRIGRLDVFFYDLLTNLLVRSQNGQIL